MNSVLFKSPLVALFMALFLVTGCASAPAPTTSMNDAALQISDPLEPVNRGIYVFNDALDLFFLEPIARGYKTVLPEQVRKAIHNMLSNLNEPVVFANDLMQWKISDAGTILGRFVINTTVGIVGMFDVAEKMGLEPHDEDFGQTLAVWGVGDGPYLMLPLFGPSNPRDAVGKVVDMVLDPFYWIVRDTDEDTIERASYVRTGVRLIDKRSRLLPVTDDIRRTSVDPYTTVKTMYHQNRLKEISDGETEEHEVPAYDFEFDFEDEE